MSDDPPRKQMNVRIPEELIQRLDVRRKELDLTRDEWVARAVRVALANPNNGRRNTKPLRTPSGRTAPPPHRR